MHQHTQSISFILKPRISMKYITKLNYKKEVLHYKKEVNDYNDS